MFGAKAGQDVQGQLPVLARQVFAAAGAVGVGQAVVGAGLIGQLRQIRRQLKGLPVVAQGKVWAAGGLVQAAQALQGLECQLPLPI